MSDVTRLLNAAAGGDPQATSELLPLVYDELRRLARDRLSREAPGHTLDATGLVHEVYLRLVGPADERRWATRGHFFTAAAEAMRRILIERARRKARLKRGGDRRREDVDPIDLSTGSTDDELLELNEALEILAAEEPVVADVVKLRYFAGLTTEQAATALGISVRTANRHWAYAKAWLFRRLRAAGHSKT